MSSFMTSSPGYGSMVLTLSMPTPCPDGTVLYHTVRHLPDVSGALITSSVSPKPVGLLLRGYERDFDEAVLSETARVQIRSTALSSFRKWRIREEVRERKRHRINGCWLRHTITCCCSLQFSRFCGVPRLQCVDQFSGRDNFSPSPLHIQKLDSCFDHNCRKWSPKFPHRNNNTCLLMLLNWCN